MVATLGELVATVTAPRRDMWPLLYPESLHTDLRKFISTLWDTLDHGDVTSLGQRGVTPLGQALATLGATPGATWADVRASVRAWRELVTAVEEGWCRLTEEAIELYDTWDNEAITKDITTVWAGNLQEETAGPGTAADNLVATGQQPPVALTSVATRQMGAATRRGQQAEKALGLVACLVATCDRAIALPMELHGRLEDMEAALEGTQEVSPDVPEALVAAVAEAEQLWEASARLATCHLLGTLEDIHRLLLSPHDSPGGCTVAEQCQRAIEDIPRLLWKDAGCELEESEFYCVHELVKEALENESATGNILRRFPGKWFRSYSVVTLVLIVLVVLALALVPALAVLS
ncbi:hypothetical protein HGM15179_018961, partial [Zosterops borbonicus]